MIFVLKIENNFDLKSTVTCGQIFRYYEKEDGFIVIIKDRILSLTEKGDYIIIESSIEDNLENIINDYFDLKRDYSKIEEYILKRDTVIKDALIFSRGLKIIHQDPFETLVAFMISQNNRVPSIAKALNLLSEKYGKKVVFKGKDYYLFPTFDDLKNLSMEDFRNCKVGFRDKYLYKIMKSLENKDLDLDKIYKMESEDSLNYLINFDGIGNKVASCILLFAYQKHDVYPIDTWVKKYMKDDYNIEGVQKIKKYTNEKYGDYSGVAIQYMFNYKRNKK